MQCPYCYKNEPAHSVIHLFYVLFRRKVCRERAAVKPCKGENSNVCVAEGCFGEACLDQPNTDLADL